MPRHNRCVLPELPCHITQRGVDRREVFSTAQDRSTYLRLLQENLKDASVRVLGYCLMSNPVHLIAVPGKEDSLSILLRRVHGRYAQYYNARSGRSGHLWQNRFFACMLGASHLWSALRYVERNPVRAGIVQHAGEYPWSSAAAHVTGEDQSGVLDMEWWRRERPEGWGDLLNAGESDTEASLRACTYAGRSFGEENFVSDKAERFGRYWNRGRPKKETAPKKPKADRASENSANQSSLF